MSASEHHTLASFRARFPHAPSDHDEMVQGVLDEAAARTPPSVWGVNTRAGHGYLAAHILGMDVHGADARLAKDSMQTTYGVLYEQLAAAVGTAMAPRCTRSA